MKDIVQHLREVAKEDSLISDFLIDLFLQEKRNPTQRTWKERYRQKLEQYTEKMREDHEDQKDILKELLSD